MKKTLIACLIASIVATSLTGCGKSDEELKKEADLAAYHQMLLDQEQKKQEEAEADKLAAEQAAADEKELNGVIAELKKGDPLIKDAYYGYNEKGDRVLHVIRDNPPQPAQPQYQQGANGQPVIINNQPAQAASSGSSESIWPVVAGIGGGMLLANAINNAGGMDRYRDYHQPYSSRNWDNDYDYRRNRTTVVNQYHTTNITNVKTAYKNPNSPAAKAFATQTGYTPPKVAPSAGSYTQAKQLSSPAARQSTQTQVAQPKPAAKPLTNPQVNSYWSQPKTQPAAQPKPAAQGNSYWGSNTKASPSSSSSSSYSSGSSSSYKSSASSSRSYSSSPARRR